MKNSRILIALLCTVMGTAVLVTTLVSAQPPLPDTPDAERLAEIGEETGSIASPTQLSPNCTFDEAFGLYLCPHPVPAVLPQANPADHARALGMLSSDGLLLVPDSHNRRIMALDPATGAVVDANFIPADTTNMDLPINAILSAAGDSILVSDQNNDVILEYDFSGSFVGIFAPLGGADSTIMDGPRGITLTDEGNLLVTTAADNVVQFDSSGSFLGEFISTDVGTGNPDSPYDIYGRSTDWLVSAINSDAIHIFAMGIYQEDFAPVDGFPQQLAIDSNGNVLVANFSGDEGVLEFTAGGTLSSTHVVTGTSSALGVRGVYILPNGNLLASAGSLTQGNVYEIDRDTAVVTGDPKLPPGSYIPRYIEFVTVPQTLLYLPVVIR
ncbi:MAG: hypothetical protein IPM53_17175 [Anaerolineaceae bacterium]|nr:hypothetical protein [Anaerolineaceae bacterium]